MGRIIRPKRFLPEEQWPPREELDHARERIERHLEILARELGDRDYLVAERFTLAEVCYAPFLAFLAMTEVEPPSPVAAWAERVLARDSAVRTEPEM